MPARSTATAADVVFTVARIAAGRDARNSETVWIGIDGCGGAGKTTLAGLIAAAVADVEIVHIDDFAGPRCQTWDQARFVEQVVAPLSAGRSARYQRWEWDRDRGGDWLDIRPGSVVLVEGVSSTTRTVPVPWALRIWVDAPRDVRLARALERDGAAMLPRWLDEWMPSEEAYVAEEDPQARADLIVSGTVPLPS